MTDDEYRMQLNVAAVIGGPMMLGNDVRIMRKETVALLTNKELIAVDQDPDGQEGKRVAKAGDTEVWAKPLAGGSIALALINRGASSAPAAVTWDQLGIEGPRQARDLWWHQPIGTVNERYVAFLSPHTSMLVKLTKPGQK
jgi:alpha-galactosidase